LAQPARPDSSALDEARGRYQRGLQLFNEGNYEAARVEFERAYQLAPSYKILYNVGLCHEQLGDYVQALTKLSKYLELGGTDIPPERRSDVAKELAQIRPRIAKVTIKTSVPGAELLVDDACATEAATNVVNCGVMSETARQVYMNPGRRRVTLRHNGYLPRTEVVTVAGSDVTEASIELIPLPKNEPKRPIPWVGWATTGALAVTSGIFGYLAITESSRLDEMRAEQNETSKQLSFQARKVEAYSIVADVAGAGAVIAAGVSLYLTIKWGKTEAPTPGTTQTAVRITPSIGALSIDGRF
jgi:hypothetical protein